MKVLIFFTVILSFQVCAQFSGTTLLEYQYGRLPNANEAAFHGVYSKPILNYSWNNLKATVGLQIYQSPFNKRNYTDLSWLGVNYKNKKWEISLGNFNSTLERGVLLRSYEIQGALLEDLSFRGKHYFYRDVLGAKVGFRRKSFSVSALWGHVLNNVFPPSQPKKDRRSDEIAALSTTFKSFQQTLGVSGIRIKNILEESYYGSSNLSGSILPYLSYYVLVAKKLNTITTESSSQAIYGNLNFSFNSLGLSAEWKDYKNFVLGSGINEPPALVKEHTYRVLNRSTHVLNPSNEKGVQFEGYFNLTDNTSLTLNYTQAINDSGKKFRYEEWFGEYSSIFSEQTDYRIFLDYATDELKNQRNRISSGFVANHRINSSIQNITIEFNTQSYKQDQFKTKNYVGEITLRYKKNLFLSFLYEWSNDRFLTNDTRTWYGTTLNYKINSTNSFSIFGGERRGGPACNAGVCYEILDFKGIEIRWSTRF